MNAPKLLYSDLHIRPETHSVCIDVLGEIGRIAKKYGARVLNGGDTHNTRGIIKTSSLDILTIEWRKWFEAGLIQDINIGNHDQEDREGIIHPMRAYASWEGWNVIEKPQIIEGIAYFPYMPRELVQPAIKAALKAGVKDALVHWGIMGAKRNDWNTDMDGIPVEWLKGFRNVFSGHYHFRNKFENVQYIGSPYQQNHSEANQPKGVLLYEQDKNKVTFHEIKNTPKHYSVAYKIQDDGEAEVEGDIDQIKKGDHVSVTVEGDSDLVAHVTHDDLRKHFDCDNVKFDRQGRVKAYSRLGITASETLNPLQLMQKYTDFVDTDLDRKKLMDIGGGLIGLHS